MPVRIRVLPRETTPAIDLGPDWVGSGALDTVIAPSGRASIPLPAGYYRVLVTHGPEFSMYDEKLELDVGESARIRRAARTRGRSRTLGRVRLPRARRAERRTAR